MLFWGCVFLERFSLYSAHDYSLFLQRYSIATIAACVLISIGIIIATLADSAHINQTTAVNCSSAVSGASNCCTNSAGCTSTINQDTAESIADAISAYTIW